jgi:hypothetical protein
MFSRNRAASPASRASAKSAGALVVVIVVVIVIGLFVSEIRASCDKKADHDHDDD